MYSTNAIAMFYNNKKKWSAYCTFALIRGGKIEIRGNVNEILPILRHIEPPTPTPKRLHTNQNYLYFNVLFS